MRQPNDTELTTFVKNGAYYTIEYYNAKNFFGVKDKDNALTKNFKREGVSQQIGEYVVVRYKPCAMELSVSGYAEISGAFYYWGRQSLEGRGIINASWYAHVETALIK